MEQLFRLGWLQAYRLDYLEYMIDEILLFLGIGRKSGHDDFAIQLTVTCAKLRN